MTQGKGERMVPLSPFGELVDTALVKGDKSQRWLARKLGLHHSTVDGWMKGIHQPSRRQVGEISILLNIDECELVAALQQDHVPI